MGKASSSKKVQRAAKAAASSRGASESREVGFPLLVGLVVVLGIGMVFFARESREPPTAPRVGQDHWHSAYTVYDCGNEVPSFQSTLDPDGIHSHQDSVIHIHPFNTSSSGEDAQLGVFLEAMRVTVSRDSIVIPEVGTISTADDCDGEPSVIKVARYQVEPSLELVAVWDDDFESIQFLEEGEAFVIARVAVGEDPPPPSANSLAQLQSKLGSDLISTDTVPLGSPTDTVPFDLSDLPDFPELPELPTDSDGTDQ